MSISAEALLVALLVGLVAGWLTAQILQRASFGLLGDLGIGVLGAFLGGWLLRIPGFRPAWDSPLQSSKPRPVLCCCF